MVGSLVLDRDKPPPRCSAHACYKVIVLLTEATVEKMFRKLISEPNCGEETFERADTMLEEELRPESPLRHRLSQELEELRSLAEKA